MAEWTHAGTTFRRSFFWQNCDLAMNHADFLDKNKILVSFKPQTMACPACGALRRGRCHEHEPSHRSLDLACRVGTKSRPPIRGRIARSAAKDVIVPARSASFEVALIVAMWMYGRFRADSPQGVGCVTSARFHHPTTLANTLIRIRALPDPLRGIGSVRKRD